MSNFLSSPLTLDNLIENHGHDGENKWYFFTQTKRNHTKGKSKYTNREVVDGYWEVSGAETKITQYKNCNWV